MSLIELRGVGHRYPGGVDVLSDVSLDFEAGEMAFVTGASGAGKSTLLKLIAGIARASRGQVRVGGQNVATLRNREIPAFRQQLGFIFQNFSLLEDRSVFDNVALPLVIRGERYQDLSRRVRAALEAVGLLAKEREYPIRLSGGEQQRAGIARAIVSKPRLLLADEPTGNLDPTMAFEVMRLFQRFNQTGMSVLVATHAIDLIQHLGQRVVHLDSGRLSEGRAVPASALGGANDGRG